MSNAYATVNTGSLNVRSTPAIGNNVLQQVQLGQVCSIIGRNSDSTWWQIRVGNVVGWVYARYVSVSNAQNVPVTNSVVVPITDTGYTLRANANLNIRSAAGTQYSRIGLLPYSAEATIIGRNSNNSWWMVQYRGINGWIYGAYIVLPANIDYTRIPVR